MMQLPSPHALAQLVSTAAHTFYGFPIAFNGECRELCNTEQTIAIMVPLMGQPLYIITACAGEQGGAALASAMFNCDSGDTNADMVEDSLRELCNIAAAQMKTLVAQHHETGLSSRLTDNRALHDVRQWCGARLLVGAQQQGEVEIAVAEFEGFN